MIEIIVSDIINTRINKVDNLLKNYSAYNEWWLIPTETLKDKENYFQFSPLPFVKIGLEEDFYQPNRMLRFKYIKGPFRGIGQWQLEKSENDSTKISYTIRIKPINSIFGLMAKTKLFKWKHSQDILNIMKKIEKKAAENKL